jgi:ABC-2 type transport system ATP-binding protein
VGTDGSRALTDSVRRLDDARIELADVALHRPTLDDVFLTLTGRAAEDEGEPEAQPPARARRRRRKERGGREPTEAGR